MKYSIKLNNNQLELLRKLKAPDETRLRYLKLNRGLMGYFLLDKPKLDWKPGKLIKVLRELFGVMAVYEYPNLKDVPGTFKYVLYSVPEYNYDAVDDALKDGNFVKEYEKKDIPILDLVYKMDQEHKAKHGKSKEWRFDDKEISEKAKVGSSIDSLKRLTGILAQTYILHLTPHGESKIIPNEDRPKWFLPNHKVSYAEKILGYP